MVRWNGILVGVGAVSGLLWAGAMPGGPWLSNACAEETAVCAAWPGEPNPLPSVGSPDPFLARWAALRAEELAGAVSALQASDRQAAQESWEHLRCLDPARAQATALLPAREVAPAPASAPLGATPTSPRPADWSPIDAELGTAQALVVGAHFAQALQVTHRIRPKLAPVEDAPGARQRRAQLEVLSATAQIALGQVDDARASFERALLADPALELDALSTSPKILQVFEAVRGRSGSPSQ